MHNEANTKPLHDHHKEHTQSNISLPLPEPEANPSSHTKPPISTRQIITGAVALMDILHDLFVIPPQSWILQWHILRPGNTG